MYMYLPPHALTLNEFVPPKYYLQDMESEKSGIIVSG